MNEPSETISISIEDRSGGPKIYQIEIRHAEALAAALLDEVSKRHPDREKSIESRMPVLSIHHPSFLLNTTYLDEIIISLAPAKWRPIAFTLTKTAAESLCKGLSAMLQRLAEIHPATKQ